MKQHTTGDLLERLKALLEREALRRGDFILSSGKKSTYYLDGRVITLTPEGAFLVATLIVERIRESGIDAIGGPTLGADPIVGALGVVAHQQGVSLTTFIVRKATKEHGTQKQVEGPLLKAGAKVIIVDDVATTGKALLEAKEALDRLGVTIIKAIVVVDRLEGARENLRSAGIPLESLLTIKDFGL